MARQLKLYLLFLIKMDIPNELLIIIIDQAANCHDNFFNIALTCVQFRDVCKYLMPKKKMKFGIRFNRYNTLFDKKGENRAYGKAKRNGPRPMATVLRSGKFLPGMA